MVRDARDLDNSSIFDERIKIDYSWHKNTQNPRLNKIYLNETVHINRQATSNSLKNCGQIFLIIVCNKSQNKRLI